MSSGTGKELPYGSDNRDCDAGGADGTALGPIVCQAMVTVSVWTGRFLLSISSQTWICTLTGSPPDSPPSSLADMRAHALAVLTRELLQSAKRNACHGAGLDCALTSSTSSAGQATDSVSRSREEITVETPSPRMLIPYRASAISIVRFWCVITSNWLVARNSS
jgi:hypothetical protein